MLKSSSPNVYSPEERPSVDQGYVRVHDLDGSKKAMRNVMRARKRKLIDELQEEGVEIGADEMPPTPDIGTLTLVQALKDRAETWREEVNEFPLIEQ